MWVNWAVYRPRITVTGISNWVRGEPRGWRASLVDHDILFFLAGTGSMKAKADREVPLAPGTCLWLTPGRIYEGTQDPNDPIRNYYIHFELVDSAGRARPYEQPTPPEQIREFDAVAVEGMFRRISTLLPYFRTDQRGRFAPERIAVAESILHGLLMDLDFASQHDLTDDVVGLQRVHTEAIMKILVDVQERPDEPRTVQSLANSTGYSVAHFSRVFHTVIGQWPEQFLIDQRMERAKMLLTTSSLSIHEVAAKLGYRQTSFFSTQFRQKVGCTPRSFRATRLKSASERAARLRAAARDSSSDDLQP